MGIYAQIFDGIVLNVVEFDDITYKQVMATETEGEVVNVTNINPLPGIGWTYDPTTSTFSEPDLESAKNEKKLEIDVAASIRRTELGTGVRDIANIYTAKGVEAQAYIADSYPTDLTNYPWIQLEVTVSGLTATEVADSIKSNYDNWLANIQTIELERRKGKINIDNATTHLDVTTTRDVAIAAIDGLVF